MKKLSLLITFVFSIISFSFAEIPIKFFKEEIHINLKKQSIQVSGLYFFENKSNFEIDVTMTYAFPIDSSHFYPDTIKVLAPESPLDFVRKRNWVEWTIHFEPSGIETVFVEYKQIIEEKCATYILSTTKLWKEKIDIANFIIEAPVEFKEMNISIRPGSVKIKGDKQLYYITRRNFVPESDLKISWQ